VTTPPFVVLADDRTGAWETAGACADLVGRAVVVQVGTPFHITGDTVIDLGSRHLSADHAGRVVTEASRLALRDTARLVHKIDSTLRGNWATEVVHAAAVHGRPVVVVPAFPAVGRTCRHGVVFDGDHPVHEGPAGRDPRRPVTSSRPMDHLHTYGASNVVELADANALTRWLNSSPVGIAVCDADNDDDLIDLGQAWANHPDAVFAGTAASVARAVGASRGPAATSPAPPSHRLPLDAPSLLVCGSLHPAARRQVDALRIHAEALAVNILVSNPREPEGITELAATEVTALLAERAGQARITTTFASIVIIGGDTAAAILGDEPRQINGTLGPGMPWTLDGKTMIVTRPGGFGADHSLIELFSVRMER
jgi:D-threonate/D-erythronate kinase